MERRTFLLSGLAGLSHGILGASTGFAAFGRKKTGIRWQSDLAAAHAAATKADKPLLILFTATWCGPCHEFKRTTLSDREMVAYIHDTFVPVLLDFDRNRRVAEVLEVERIPCTVLLSPEADLLGRLVGGTDPDRYKLLLSRARSLQDEIRRAERLAEVRFN